jgi:drug/metabolite transporter (DMT)-like permease
LNWFFFGGARPTWRKAIGIAISVAGVVLLSRSQTRGEVAGASFWGIAAVFGAVILWSFGTLVQRKTDARASIFTFTGYQLAFGALVVAVASAVFEGPAEWRTISFSTSGALAFVYLVVFGSAVAFSAYLWLSRNVDPTKVSTYAVVNPLIAVWLGWLFADERVGIETIAFSGLILLGIAFVVFDRPKTAPSEELAPA